MRAIFSSDSDVLVGLDAQAPLRVLQAILDGAARILLEVCAIHRLQKESLERQVCKSFRRGVVLWKDELELVAFDDREFAIRFQADADPVDSGRRHDCPVGLHGDLEATPMEGLDQRGVHLQQGLSARTQKRWPSPPVHSRSIASARSSALLYRPPLLPSVPTKSVSQNLHAAVARSASRPDQRLQPAKRQNTAGRPACAPSPCRVRKISFTAKPLMRSFRSSVDKPHR